MISDPEEAPVFPPDFAQQVIRQGLFERRRSLRRRWGGVGGVTALAIGIALALRGGSEPEQLLASRAQRHPVHRSAPEERIDGFEGYVFRDAPEPEAMASNEDKGLWFR